MKLNGLKYIPESSDVMAHSNGAQIKISVLMSLFSVRKTALLYYFIINPIKSEHFPL